MLNSKTKLTMKNKLALITTLIVLTFKLNAQINYDWSNDVEGTSSSSIWSVKASDKGYYSTGIVKGSVTYDQQGNYTYTANGTGSNGDIFFAKYTTSGVIDWIYHFGTTQNDIGLAIEEDSQGNVYLGGYFSDNLNFDPDLTTLGNLNNSGGQDGFIAKYNDQGDLLWVNQIHGTGDDQVRGLAINSDDELIVTGVFSNTATFSNGQGSTTKTSSGNWDIFLSKFDTNGNLIFVESFGSTGNDLGWDVEVDNDDNIVMNGYFTDQVNFDPNGSAVLYFDGGTDGFLAKYNNNGDYIWANKISGDYHDWVVSVGIDSNNDIYCGGYFQSSTLNVDFAGNNMEVAHLESGREGYVVKFNSIGTYEWAQCLKGPGNNEVRFLTVDENDQVFATGYAGNTFAWYPFWYSQPDTTFQSSGAADFFITHIDNNGTVLNTDVFGSNENDISYTIDKKEEKIIIGGYFNETVDFNNDISTVSDHTSIGTERSAFVAVYNDETFEGGVSTDDFETDVFDFNIYPNPTNSQITISSDVAVEAVKIISLDGRTVFNKNFTGDQNEIEIDLDFLSSGKYVVILNSLVMKKLEKL